MGAILENTVSAGRSADAFGRMVVNLRAHLQRQVSLAGSYAPQWDGVRVLAIAPVLFWHASLRGDRLYALGDKPPSAFEQWMSFAIPKGEVGVELFFVLSGLMISAPFLGEAARSIDAKAFYVRRMTRLYPLYLFVLLLSFAMLSVTGYAPTDAPSVGKAAGPLWHSLFASLIYVHQLVFNAHPTLNPPAWSLEVEIQFYAVAPLLIMAWRRITAPTWRLYAGLALTTLSMVLAQTVDAAFGVEARTHYSLLRFLPFFLTGMTLSVYMAQPARRADHRAYDLACLTALGLLAFSGRYMSLSDPIASTAHDLVRVSAMSIILVAAARGPATRRILSNPYVSTLGAMTYSVYLINVPVIQLGSEILKRLSLPDNLVMIWLACFALLVPATIIAGGVLYVCLERPTMNPNWPVQLRDLWRERKARRAKASEDRDGL
jgi:peptidoglycan/LPS O-acetylase OafA/YrhL